MASPQKISIPIAKEPNAPRTWPGEGGDEAIAEVTSVNSMFGLLSRTAAEKPTRDLFGWREVPAESPYQFISYAAVRTKIICLANTLIDDCQVKKGDRIGVYGKNCAAWVTIQYAINASGGVLVPIYDTLGPQIVEYVCNHAEVEVVFVATENLEKFNTARDKCSTVKHVVRFDVGAIDSLSDGTDTIGSFIKKGNDDPDALPSVECEDLSVIMYTSGTTGNPKGVCLSNGNILSSVGSALHFFAHWGIEFTTLDSYLSYLPLSHIFEQQAEALLIARGGRIGYYSGNIKLLTSDLDALKPSIFCGVPRVFARFQQKIQETVGQGGLIKRRIFKTAYDRQLISVQRPGKIIRNKVWDLMVMNKVRAKLLPNARLVITGSAPMSPQTNDFLKIVLNCPVLQGYGLTETVGGMNCSAPNVSVSGTVGGPLPGSYVKLHDLPEMGYLSTNKPPQGEVCIKGGIVFKGYYKNDEGTSGAFDEDGYFHTGDVGQWNTDGTLQIIDRAKNLFKLAQGEYVSPEALEQEYAKAPLVLQIFVYGDSLESTLLAVVVPDAEHALPWGRKNNLNSLSEIAGSEKFKVELMQQLLKEHAKAKFKSYEKISDVIIEVGDLNELGQGFHVGNNLATPTFKLKRPQLKSKYKSQLDQLYSKLKK